jgi:hypothetical protein
MFYRVNFLYAVHLNISPNFAAARRSHGNRYGGYFLAPLEDATPEGSRKSIFIVCLLTLGFCANREMEAVTITADRKSRMSS